MRSSKTRHIGVPIALLAAVLLATAACGRDSPAPPGGGKGKEAGEPAPRAAIDKPTELTIYHPWGLTQQQFMDLEGKHIVKKYPNLSFKVLNSTNGTLENLMLAGTKIDIIYSVEGNYFGYKDKQLISDTSDLVQKNKVNLNAIDPGVFDYLKQLWSGQMYGLPTSIQTTALYYNKDLFDKFAVPYPGEQMTWDELYEKAVRLTRQDGGILYRGFASRTVSNDFVYNQLSLPLVDPVSHKAVYNTDKWKQLITDFARLYQMPGYQLTPEIAALPKSVDLFVKERTLAMLTWTSSDFTNLPNDLNWRAAALPSFKEKPGVGQQYGTIIWYLSSVSPNREAAFLAMMEAVSPEVQMEMSKAGQMSVLSDPAIRQAFGSNLSGMKDRNLQAIIPKKSAAKPANHPLTANIVPHLGSAFDSVRLGQKDINTALREAEEKTNKWMADRMAGN